MTVTFHIFPNSSINDHPTFRAMQSEILKAVARELFCGHVVSKATREHALMEVTFSVLSHPLVRGLRLQGFSCKKISGLGSRTAWRQNEMIGGKLPVGK
jgi:hypothetical protein